MNTENAKTSRRIIPARGTYSDSAVKAKYQTFVDKENTLGPLGNIFRKA